ncbi:molybdopterin converting factor subunit 1 [Bacillus fonticola]|uniref:molybdopterin converting factor subunit 1 n=1 Tax=Bacillus fonticola TaxID=2728853 RepID=UPI001474495A|nr:molybdopterin converting factor subunit 1 [Bacillus fonticola]
MITILFFANIREEVGSEKIELDVKEMTILQLKEHLQSMYQLKSVEHAMTAINESFVTDDGVVKENDTVAFIPPVSGG